MWNLQRFQLRSELWRPHIIIQDTRIILNCQVNEQTSNIKQNKDRKAQGRKSILPNFPEPFSFFKSRSFFHVLCRFKGLVNPLLSQGGRADAAQAAKELHLSLKGRSSRGGDAPFFAFSGVLISPNSFHVCITSTRGPDLPLPRHPSANVDVPMWILVDPLELEFL